MSWLINREKLMKPSRRIFLRLAAGAAALPVVSRAARANLLSDVADHVERSIPCGRVVAETNAQPKPFVWTADPNRILAAVKRGKQALESTWTH
jgi:hypothetical protein